ncbi:hypothetical protein ACQRAW_06880 [Fusicatenibacter saccharivorans]|uniref:hypothetical protein n=1 Tax=Fusicatenibacter saccharivorans TaxID=1150298 RepID=UPI003D0194F6
MQMCPYCDKVYDESEYSHCPYCSGELSDEEGERYFKNCPNCGGIMYWDGEWEFTNCGEPSILMKMTTTESSKDSVGNFISANALPVDCDNDHSDDPADWITPEDVAAAFPNVAFVVHYSRHHLLMKSFRSPRPRFHVVFAIEPMTDAKAYADAQTQVQQYFPYFDTNALDAARFFFGTTEPSPAVRNNNWSGNTAADSSG